MTPTDAQREAAGQTRHVVWLNPGSVRHLASDQLPWPPQPHWHGNTDAQGFRVPTDEQLLAEELAAGVKHGCLEAPGPGGAGILDGSGYRLLSQAEAMELVANTHKDQTLGDQVSEDARFRQHPLYQAFKEAWRQATSGKGQRHGGDATPFYAQSWRHIADAQGPGFLVGQAEKKLHEAGVRVQTKPKDCSEPLPQVGDHAWQREVLGALVYGGMAWLHATRQMPKEGGHG